MHITLPNYEFDFILRYARLNGDAQAQGFNDHEEAQEAHRATVRAERRAKFEAMKAS